MDVKPSKLVTPHTTADELATATTGLSQAIQRFELALINRVTALTTRISVDTLAVESQVSAQEQRIRGVEELSERLRQTLIDLTTQVELMRGAVTELQVAITQFRQREEPQ